MKLFCILIKVCFSFIFFCTACDCFSVGITDNGYCNKNMTRTDIALGQCNCKDNVFGRQCDECVPGYWGFRLPPGGHCQGNDNQGGVKILEYYTLNVHT